MQAIILAGGKGTRLAERLAGKPKPLVDVCGVPLLERQIRALEAHGVGDVIVLVNHAAEQIRSFLAVNRFAANIQIVDDGDPRGTAGAVLACLDMMGSQALIIYGDTLFDIDVSHMLAAHDASGADATLLLHPNDHPADSDLVELDAHGYVSDFHNHPHPPNADLRNLVNAAFYVVERDALERWHDMPVPSDFAHDLFPAMIAAGQRLFGYVSAEYIKDLGTPSRLDKVERHFTSGIVQRASRRLPQNAVFIDRDGTLNRPAGHIAAPDAITLIPGSAGGLKRLNDAGLRTAIITNQPVIARGECDLATLNRIHGRLEMLLSEAGAYVDRIYFCPHHPHRGFSGEIASLKIECACRKPEVGMIEEAIKDLNINRFRSWMVGDTAADMGAASKASLLSILVLTGEDDTSGEAAREASVVVDDFAAAAAFVVERYPVLLREALAHVPHIRDGDLVLIDDASPVGMAAVLRNELRAAGRTAIEIGKSAERTDFPAGATLIVHGQANMPSPNVARTIYQLQIEAPERSPL